MDIQSIYFGQRNPKFDSQDFSIVKKVSRLAKKHHRLCEYSCNGVGWIKGVCYHSGSIDDYARRQYGAGVKSAYINEDDTIFDIESEKIEDKILALLNIKTGIGITSTPALEKWRVEFQGDPRGATVKLFYNNQYIEL